MTADELYNKAMVRFDGKLPSRLYATSDGSLFVSKNLAQYHARKHNLKLYFLHRPGLIPIGKPEIKRKWYEVFIERIKKLL